MPKAFSVDYWVDPDDIGQPDRSDYSDDLEALAVAAPHQLRFDGAAFTQLQFYKRVGEEPGEMNNWESISSPISN